jgi:hypothetical protein
MSVRHSGDIAKRVVQELQGGSDGSGGGALSFEEFANAFGEMIDESGQSIELPKVPSLPPSRSLPLPRPMQALRIQSAGN